MTPPRILHLLSLTASLALPRILLFPGRSASRGLAQGLIYELSRLYLPAALHSRNGSLVHEGLGEPHEFTVLGNYSGRAAAENLGRASVRRFDFGLRRISDSVGVVPKRRSTLVTRD
ncbi:hypothetical protein KM043_000722 [Ampulex compressa]|nr:hypothetical protein KM043_000722 [Ampulex compressa]